MRRPDRRRPTALASARKRPVVDPLGTSPSTGCPASANWQAGRDCSVGDAFGPPDCCFDARGSEDQSSSCAPERRWGWALRQSAYFLRICSATASLIRRGNTLGGLPMGRQRHWIDQRQLGCIEGAPNGCCASRRRVQRAARVLVLGVNRELPKPRCLGVGPLHQIRVLLDLGGGDGDSDGRPASRVALRRVLSRRQQSPDPPCFQSSAREPGGGPFLIGSRRLSVQLLRDQ